MKSRWAQRFVPIALVILSLVSANTTALAGTTGSISGVVNAEGKPVANATVTALSPSGSTGARTDASGHFSLVSLAPDTYTISVTHDGFQPISQPGITVQADQSLTLTFNMQPALRTIASVQSRGSADVVRPGTTSDVYSVNSSVQAAAAPLGGGGSLTQAYAGIASVPGVYIPQGQAGWAQSVYIRGGNYTHLGYEFDGVPVQRAFDQYPGTNVSTLGQSELQVYTGSAPANSQSTGLAGFINQVIRTGTYPGYASLNGSIGTPTFYHQAAGQVGGASPDRLFSYYVGISGSNQAFRYASQYNGADLDQSYGSLYNIVAANCGTPQATTGCYPTLIGPNGYALGPFSYATQTQYADRENVVNLHFGLPHKNDGGRDDIQLLADVGFIRTYYGAGLNYWSYAAPFVTDGSALYNGVVYPNCATAGVANNCAIFGAAAPTYLDTSLFTGQIGSQLTAANVGSVTPYLFPNSPSNRSFGSAVDPNATDTYNNNSSIFKLQYQKNFGSNAFLRLYGYTFYSDWLNYGPNGITQNFIAAVSPNYDLISHTRGVSLMGADQLSPQHLLNISFGYTQSNTIRWNNQFYNNAFGSSQAIAVLVSSANPFGGCYNAGGLAPGGAATLADCGGTHASQYRFPPSGTALVPRGASPVLGTENSFMCGGAPCEYLIANSGMRGPYNTVKPYFTEASLEDNFRPTDRINLRVGVHYDDFRYGLADTRTPMGPLPGSVSANVRDMFTTSWNAFHCFSPATGVIATATPNACPAGTVQGAFSDVSPANHDFHEFQPRIGATYTMGRNDVLRASWGLYLQPASTAFQQYNRADVNIAAGDQPFYSFGYTTPDHQVRPEKAYNADFSWEHQFGNSDVSMKITPFYRRTHDQIFNVLLDPVTNFVSGVNVGNETVSGLEFFLRKGNFNNNGLAGQLSFTYTHGTVKFNPFSNGTNALTGVNNSIAQYNAYTSFCAANSTDKRCGTTSNGLPASPCYDSTGAPVTCATAGAIANPYWNAPVQNTFDPSAEYIPYNQLPGTGLGAVSSSYIVPYVSTLILSYRHNKWAVTPSLQFAAGGRYGSPVQGIGIDPAAGCAPLAGSITGDPRYPYGGAGGAPYDASTCGASIVTPNEFTRHFDNFGEFREPSQITMNLEASYDISPKVTLRATAVNVYNHCFGGGSYPWAVGSGSVGCWYGTPLQYAGNFYNPGNTFQPNVKFPYAPQFGTVFQQIYGAQANPFNLYLNAEIKL